MKSNLEPSGGGIHRGSIFLCVLLEETGTSCNVLNQVSGFIKTIVKSVDWSLNCFGFRSWRVTLLIVITTVRENKNKQENSVWFCLSGVCPEPGGIKFSSRTSYSGPYNVGHTVTYSCQDGSSGTITYQSTRAWTTKPTCSGLFWQTDYIRFWFHPTVTCAKLLFIGCNLLQNHLI